MARLIIPDDFTSQLTLLNNIIAQNTALGAASPLTAFLTQHDIVLTNDAATGGAAQTHDVSRALLRKQSENYRQLRDHVFLNILPTDQSNEKKWLQTPGQGQKFRFFKRSIYNLNVCIITQFLLCHFRQ